jgi:hypothetical protein
MTFIQIDDDTHISLAAIRSIRRNGDKVKIEFNDGTVRSYAAKLDIFNHLDDLVGEIVPATGWRLAEYVVDKVEYQTVIAFRIKPGMLEPIAAGWFDTEDYTLVDPHGRFIGFDLHTYEIEAEFVSAILERLKAEAADEAAQ